ncbi:zinc finger MYM-type protein 1-like [Aphis craccivora]|uniref:Zinc finger MYM-type protein 1-like n=1 Tax=Aphis craccivora TaxID=307492 RepID=A0A6G0Z4Y5_APHCR|nr:zinc finger MYM-type protein 1-like [Aphis craccivora]
MTTQPTLSIKAVWVLLTARSQAQGLVKKVLSFDSVHLLFPHHSWRILRTYKIKILTEAIELNIIDALILIDYSIGSLTKMNKDDISMNNLVSSAITFSGQLETLIEGKAWNMDKNRCKKDVKTSKVFQGPRPKA